jgi:hypothetical protein
MIAIFRPSLFRFGADEADPSTAWSLSKDWNDEREYAELNRGAWQTCTYYQFTPTENYERNNRTLLPSQP